MSLKQRKNRSRKSHSKNLTQDDVIAFLDKYITDFEDNLRDNNFDKMNTQLIVNLISKFDKIFQLWDENRILQNSIERNYFEKIHQSMLNTFGTEIENRNGESVNDYEDNFILECKQCGEEFPLRNKDCRYSYDLHTTSEEHKEFVQNLNIHDSDSSSDPDTPDQMNSDTDTFVDAYEQLFIYARCNLCYFRITMGDMDYKTHESVAAKSIMVHLEGQIHRFKVRIFRENKKYIEEVSLGKNLFRCKLCHEDLYLDKLVGHFMTEDHKNKVLVENGTSPETDSSEEDGNVPLLQPLIRNCMRSTKTTDSKNFKTLASRMRELCVIDENNPEAASNAQNRIEKLNKNQIPIQLDENSISIFDARCIIIKNDSLQCKICRVKLVKPLICHMKGKEHLKMAKRYGSFGRFIEEKDDKIQCTLCDDYEIKSYRKFFKHCQSNENHLEKVKKSSMESNFIVQWEAAEVIQCPVVECSKTVSKIERLFTHLKSVHKIK